MKRDALGSKDIQVEVSNAATEIESKVVAVEIPKEYGVSEVSLGLEKEDKSTVKVLTIAEREDEQIHLLSTFLIHLKESDHDLLIACINQSLIVASGGLKEFNGFNFGVKPPEGLHPKGFESVFHPIRLFTLADINHCFIKLITQSNLFQFSNNDMDHLRKDMKKLINSLASTYRCCLFMRIWQTRTIREKK